MNNTSAHPDAPDAPEFDLVTEERRLWIGHATDGPAIASGKDGCMWVRENGTWRKLL